MKYEKPKLVRVEQAIRAIRGAKNSPLPDSVQPGNPIPTAAAYEADE